MTIDTFLVEALAVLGTGVGMVFLCARLRVPAVVGLILTGFLIGPYGLALVSEVEEVEVFAEIGVVLLLFIIGLEINVSQLAQLRRPFLIGGTIQTLLTTVVAGAFALPWVPGPPAALFTGMVVTLSSTAVVLKLYDERRETRAPHGRASLGILLFQDLLIVPFIVLAPILAGRAEASFGELVLRFGGGLAAIAAVVVLARVVMPHLLHQVVRTRVRELLVMAGLVGCLAMAWFTHAMGLSLALGAFLAGILVSESEYSHQLVADILPFRDVFASIFFISIGMLVDLRLAADNLWVLLAVTALVVVIKAGGASLAVKAAGYPIETALITGLGLAQIGEFSFVLLEVGGRHGLLTTERFQMMLSVAVTTLLVTPLLVRAAPAVAARVAQRFIARESAQPVAAEERLSGHVIVVGLGEHGTLLCKVLGEANIPFVALDLDPDVVKAARASGVPVHYGDATRLEILDRAGVHTAQIVVVTVAEPRSVLRSLAVVQQENPDAALLVATPYMNQIPAFRAAGADEVVSEELEAAIEVFTRVLEHYHIPRNVIRAQVRLLRGEDYQLLRAPQGTGRVSDRVLEVLEQGTADLYRIGEGNRAVGCSLRDLDLRGITGASVIAIVRGQDSIPNPSPDLQLASGDQLVLVGDHLQIERAFAFLKEQVAKR